MPGGGDTKHRAKRIDPSYLKKSHWLRSGRAWIGLVLLVVAGLAIGTLALRKDREFASPGSIAAVHRTVKKCESCHAGSATTTAFSLHVTDEACQKCHRVPVHQPNEGKTPPCAACHVEHRDNPKLIDVASPRCTRCHADLEHRPLRDEDSKDTAFVQGTYRKISTFAGREPDVHKEFQIGVGPERHPLDPVTRRSDPARIKFSHKVHLSPNLPGPPGDLRVQLVCGDCHRSAFEPARLKYRRRTPPTNACSTEPGAPLRPEPELTLAERSLAPAEEPQYFAPVRYQDHCAACHPHTVDDPRIDPVPHDTPAIVRAYLQGAYARYALDNSEAPNGTPRKRPIGDGADATSARAMGGLPTRAMEEWARGEVTRAEDALYRRSCPTDQCSRRCDDGVRCCDCCRRCIECHYVGKELDGDLPVIVPPAIPSRWLPHSRFDHAAHRNVRCEQCHVHSMESQAATDVLMPKIKACQHCHKTDGASDRCAECHTYHAAMEPRQLYGPDPMKALTASSGDGGT